MQRHKGRNTPGSSRSSRGAGVAGAEWEQVGGGAGKEAGGREHRGHLSSKRGGEAWGVEPSSDVTDI